MQTNYYFLRQLSRQLNEKLKGWIVGTCFSQDKDELVIGFYADKQEFYIRAILQPELATLVFFDEFRRAKQNSVDLFAEITGTEITGVIQYENERAFALQLDNEYLLLFKMFGNRSNVILFKDGQFVSMFQNKLAADENINPEKLNRPIVQNFDTFSQNSFSIQKIYPTFGKIILQYIESQTFISQQEKWDFIKSIVEKLENPVFYISFLTSSTDPHLLLLPLGDIQFQTSDPIEGANKFYSFFARISFFDKEKNQVLRSLEKRKNQLESFLLKGYDKLSELENESKNEQFANILMANLHELESGIEKAELYDFYHDKPVIIKLKKDLSPQKNAEIYYRKAKNSGIEIEKLKEVLAAKENELIKTESFISDVTSIENLKTFRKYLKDNGLDNEKNNPDIPELFKNFSFMGFEIRVGKNARNNDLLTQKYAYKEDLWLHAKDVTGSHVLIKYQSGKNFPEPVIEKAASLAAYYSKNRNESLCAVIVTPKKYVRKTKDLAEGQVIIDKESVILVEPSDF
jgi:predicted ribosome quality control (RQC) complex YloA/Tae2 family protein